MLPQGETYRSVCVDMEGEYAYTRPMQIIEGQRVAMGIRPEAAGKREPTSLEVPCVETAGGAGASIRASRAFPDRDGGAYGLTALVGAKTPKYAGKSDWDAFRAQFELLAQACGWSDEQKALQLALCLTDDALSCLLLLDPSERANYKALVGALERRYGQCFRSELLRSELHARLRRAGEPLRALANDIEALARRAYAHMPTPVQTELARDQFIRALSPSDLRVHTQLARPQTLTDALEYAMEREMIVGAARHDASPVVRAAEECQPTAQRPPWVDEVTQMIRGLALPPNQHQQARQRSRPPTQPRLCWGCGQPGHLVKSCPALARGPGNGTGAQ